MKGILITPSDSKAIVPALQKARSASVMIIARDSPTEPQDATDALFATDNFKASELIGQYAKAAMAGKPAKIATLDLAPGVAVGKLRHDGFLKGYGIAEGEPSIVCSQDTGGDQAKGQTAMENCLQKAPDINVVHTINEPAALGAYTALKAKGREKDVLIVSVDGGCTGTKAVQSGQIAATSQQYRSRWRRKASRPCSPSPRAGPRRPATPTPAPPSSATSPSPWWSPKDTAFGLQNCWGWSSMTSALSTPPAPAGGAWCSAPSSAL
ncbi:substrate-binding domain-containing protein [Nonomuraea pusilla]|uniref:substrate-binding domain-containing protein n=1 Tax=Nonomuraea pusilla TaxID=46177 RepID=UPI003333CF0F